MGTTEAVTDDTLMACITPGAPTVHYNGDVVTQLPTGSVVLAATEDGAPQAVRFGSYAWGLQCHPEVGGAIFDRWAASDSAAGRDPRDAAATSDVVHAAEEALVTTWRPVLHRFAALLTS